ncbi:hypothetical protein ACFWIJ_23135 [Streptomyces sp. NPDC127079]|uniref:hypothetical protein n=1 Tax=Streptomyces sp. NPDC127079 TaxID=3347132 RepID=UPI0036691CB6
MASAAASEHVTAALDTHEYSLDAASVAVPPADVEAGCGGQLRPEARPDSVYCSGVCRSRQWRRERRLRK